MGGGARKLLLREIDEHGAVEAVAAAKVAEVAAAEVAEVAAAVEGVEDRPRQIVAAARIGSERAEDDGRGAADGEERGDDEERGGAAPAHGSSARWASDDQRPDG